MHKTNKNSLTRLQKAATRGGGSYLHKVVLVWVCGRVELNNDSVDKGAKPLAVSVSPLPNRAGKTNKTNQTKEKKVRSKARTDAQTHRRTDTYRHTGTRTHARALGHVVHRCLTHI